MKNNYFSKLCHYLFDIVQSVTEFEVYLQGACRTLDDPAFESLMRNLNCDFRVRLESDLNTDNLGGIKAIDIIINEIKKIDARIIAKFQTSLNVIFTKTNTRAVKLSSSIKNIMKLGSLLLGRLARTAGVMTEKEIKMQV